jgi:hypothetical protein
MNFHYFHTARGAIAIRSHAPSQEHPGLIRACLWRLLILGLGALLVSLVPPAKAQPITYDKDLAGDRLLLVQHIQRTSKCMHTAAVAGLREGMKRREHLESFTASVCGLPIRNFLISRVGMDVKDAERSVNAMAADAVKDVLSWGR